MRMRANWALVQQIRSLHAQSRQRYGSPRIHQVLQAQRLGVGRHRVARLMRQAGLCAQSRRRYRVTTDAQPNRPVAPNRLQRAFQSDAPNEKWMADITYIPTGEGWLYLAVILDVYARRVVGWAMRSRLQDQRTLATLDRALKQRQPSAPLLHHSDRGRQYTSATYQARLRHHGLRPPMSRAGNCWDNAVVESFFATLKTELIHHQSYATWEQARLALFEYIEGFYNTQRSHSSLGYISPAEFERRYVA